MVGIAVGRGGAMSVTSFYSRQDLRQEMDHSSKSGRLAGRRFIKSNARQDKLWFGGVLDVRAMPHLSHLRLARSMLLSAQVFCVSEVVSSEVVSSEVVSITSKFKCVCCCITPSLQFKRVLPYSSKPECCMHASPRAMRSIRAHACARNRVLDPASNARCK